MNIAYFLQEISDSDNLAILDSYNSVTQKEHERYEKIIEDYLNNAPSSNLKSAVGYTYLRLYLREKGLI